MSAADVDFAEKTEIDVEAYVPKQYKVILHNDDRTTFDFVIALLRVIFHRSTEDAHDITLDIHTNGHGIAGIYTKEVAEEKMQESMQLAVSSGYPLQVTYEED